MLVLRGGTFLLSRLRIDCTLEDQKGKSCSPGAGRAVAHPATRWGISRSSFLIAASWDRTAKQPGPNSSIVRQSMDVNRTTNTKWDMTRTCVHHHPRTCSDTHSGGRSAEGDLHFSCQGIRIGPNHEDLPKSALLGSFNLFQEFTPLAFWSVSCHHPGAESRNMYSPPHAFGTIPTQLRTFC